MDIHSVAGVLKGYLREIPECVFTSEGVTKLVAAHRNITETSTKIREFDRIIYKLHPLATLGKIVIMVRALLVMIN